MGITADTTVTIDGHAGYYAAGMHQKGDVTINGNAGVGLAENIMSGRVQGAGRCVPVCRGHRPWGPGGHRRQRQTPIYVKIGASRPHYDTALAVKSGADVVVDGIRTRADIAKAMALGADAVAIGTAALIALGDNDPRYAAEYSALGSAAGFSDDFQDGRDPPASPPRIRAFLPAGPGGRWQAAGQLPACPHHGGPDRSRGPAESRTCTTWGRGPGGTHHRSFRNGPRAAGGYLVDPRRVFA